MDGAHDQATHKLRNVEQQVQSLLSLLAKAADDIDTLAEAGCNAEAIAHARQRAVRYRELADRF